jgi:hypothetical protein
LALQERLPVDTIGEGEHPGIGPQVACEESAKQAPAARPQPPVELTREARRAGALVV